MSTEAETTTTEPTAPAKEATPSPPLDASAITPSEGYKPAEATNMFDDEVITEDMLRGEDVETPKDEPAATETKPDESDPKEETPPDQGKEEQANVEEKQEAVEESKESEPQTPEKPPKGFVPYKALQEERNKRKELTQQLAELQEAVELLGAKEAQEGEAEEDKFAVLGDEELEALIEEDPQEALRYQVRLQRHQTKERAKRLAAQTDEMRISEAAMAIQQVVPDIYDENSNTATELADFAVERGFDPDYLPLLTDPRTKIIAPDGKTRMILGTGAASVIKLIADMKGNQAVSEDAVRSKLEKEVTEQITQKILAKMKHGSDTPVSINDLPGAPEEISGDTLLTEREMARMSPEELDRYLRGG